MSGKTNDKLRNAEEQIKQREKREADRLIEKDLDELYTQEQFDDYLNSIMDNEKDNEKFKILKSFSGIINSKSTVG